MSQQGSEKPGDAGSQRDLTSFFVAGGAVQPGRGCYVRRGADRELARLVRAGDYVQVIAPRHMGKSSLMARLADELRREEHGVAVVDLTQIGARERPDDLGRWFYSFAFRLIRQLRLRVDLQVWWQDRAVLTNRQRLTELYWDLILSNTTGPVTIFVDELQCLDQFPGAEHLLASIRAAYNARAAEPALARLNFVMLGINIPEGFDADSESSPFPVSQSVALRDFRLHQIDAFAPALGLPRPQAAEALERIHFWTGGQPYLTQKLARAVARARMRDTDLSDPAFIVDALTYRLYLNPASLQNEPHLSYLHQTLTEPRRETDELLTVYGKVRKGGKVIVDPESAAQRRLLTHGLLVPTRGGTLAVRNRVYHQVFTSRWANEQLPFRWRRISMVAVIATLLVLVPIWYQQFLPRPWTRVLASTTATLEEARSAHAALSRLPGHGATADRMLLDFLSRMSRGSSDVAAVEAADRLLRTLPGAAPIADQLAAEFWDRQATEAEFRHERDAGLLARLRALIVPTVERRRRAAALIGEDYRLLEATLRVPDGFEQAVVSRDGRRLLAVKGSTVYGWRIDRLPPEAQSPWEATALRFLPAVSRRSVTGDGRAGPGLGLMLDIEHDRPFDLSITLTAPSGRSATFSPGFSAGSRLRYEFDAGAGGALESLSEEPRGGTWTLTVSDRVPGVTGRLTGWSLAFDELVFGGPEPALALTLEDPQPEADSLVFLGPAGRYAVAVPPTGEAAARVWDLASRSPISTLPVTQRDRIIGFVLDQRVALVQGEGGIEAWTLSTGDPADLAGVGSQALLSALSPGGDVLAALGGGVEDGIQVFDLIEGRLLGRIAPGVAHTALAAAPGGRLVAVADPDRAVRIWRIGDDQPLAELDPPAQPVGLAFGPLGDQLAISMAEGGVMLWRQRPKGGEIRHFADSDTWYVSFDPGGSAVLIGNAERGFRLLDRTLAPLDLPVLRPGGTGESGLWAAVRRAQGLAMTGDSMQGRVRLWRLPETAPVPAAAPSDGRASIALSRRGDLVALGTEAGNIRILPTDTDSAPDPAAGDRVGFFGHAEPVSGLAFSPDGALLASIAIDGSLRVWESSGGEPRDFIAFQPTSEPVRLMAVMDAGDRVVTVSGNQLRLWDAMNGRQILEQRQAARVTAIAAVPGQAEVLFGDADGVVWRLSAAGDRNERVFDSGSTISAIAVSEDGRSLAIAVADGTLQLVDLRDRQLKGSGGRLAIPADTLAFSAERDYLIVRSGHWLHSYRLSVNQLLPEGSRLLPAAVVYPGFALEDGRAAAALVLAGDPVPRPVRLALDAGDVTPLPGDEAALLEQWRDRVRALGPAAP